MPPSATTQLSSKFSWPCFPLFGAQIKPTSPRSASSAGNQRPAPLNWAQQARERGIFIATPIRSNSRDGPFASPDQIGRLMENHGLGDRISGISLSVMVAGPRQNRYL